MKYMSFAKRFVLLVNYVMIILIIYIAMIGEQNCINNFIKCSMLLFHKWMIVCLSTDIKECSTNPCSQSCFEKEGSYECACNLTGYTLDTDQKTCIGMHLNNFIYHIRVHDYCHRIHVYQNLKFKYSILHFCSTQKNGI